MRCEDNEKVYGSVLYNRFDKIWFRHRDCADVQTTVETVADDDRKRS